MHLKIRCDKFHWNIVQHFSQVYIVASLRTDFLLLFKDMHQLFTSSLLAQACHWACFRFMIESKVLAIPP
ncbi:hypothetical protein SAB0268 [Staphylococcus aureus RF122]|nr:hypothetical protein SAB0268 [Staphylococcus aureus RF122]